MMEAQEYPIKDCSSMHMPTVPPCSLPLCAYPLFLWPTVPLCPWFLHAYRSSAPTVPLCLSCAHCSSVPPAHCSSMPAVPLYPFLHCAYCFSVPTAPLAHCSSMLTVPLCPLFLCAHCPSVLTVSLWLSSPWNYCF